MIWIGTSGFQYPEWRGTFYPEKLSTAKMLPFYASEFPTTEINYTFNRIPSEKTLTNWSASTPAKFRFSLKAPKEITHVRRLADCEGTVNRFCEVIGTLGDKLGIVLFQLPPFLKKDPARLTDFLASLPRGLKCAFEFRHPTWFVDETFGALKARNAALCIAESEELATPVVFTADYGYFRLRRTDYTANDLGRWAGVLREQRERLTDVFVYLKHEESGVGPKFAKQLTAQVGG